MLKRWSHLAYLTATHWRFLLAVSCSFLLGYYAVQLAAMMIKFGQLPNYIHGYNWFGNVRLILESTPSWRDSLMIIKGEWLLELGYMNYEYGFGIALWSLYLSPAKAIAVIALGTMLGLLWLLTRRSISGCRMAGTPYLVTGGLGATLVSMSLMSLSWVVCCATPTWVVGLAILGLSASTALWLEPIGVWLNSVGFLAVAAVLLMASTMDGDDSNA